MTTATLQCPNCRTANEAAATFCTTCGHDLREGRDPQDRTTYGVWPEGRPQSQTPAPAIFDRLRQATLGYYDVAAELGRGGMAAVYLAHDLRLDRKVAIKVMLPELTTGEEMVERFRREARTAGNLSHPHIIPIYHVHDEEGMVFFVMKFVEGRSLDSAVREMGPLPIKMVEAILSQTSGALAYAHRRGVIHRDIKPANIMLDEDGWAVVTDFGIAKVADASMLTSTGSMMGTPYYMSPEQCSAKPVTGASDQYSLGVTCYELLTGAPPFAGTSLMEVMGGHFFTPPTAIREKRPDCPAALEQVVLRMLAKDPGDRFASLDDVVSALKAPVLQHDDPVRGQMIDLARSGAKLRQQVSVPVSPVPLPRPSAARRPVTSGAQPVVPPPMAAPSKPATAVSRRGFFSIAATVLGVAATAVLVLRPGARPPQTEPIGVPSQRMSVEMPLDAPPTNAPEAVLPTPSPTKPAVNVPEEPKPRPASRPRREPAVIAPPAVKETVLVVQRDTVTAPGLVADPKPATPLDSIGAVLVGSRTPRAFYYVNGNLRELISTPRSIRLPAGRVRLSIGAEGCAPWDTTVTVVGGETVRLGYKTLTCNAPTRP